MSSIPVFPKDRFLEEMDLRVGKQNTAVEWARQVRAASEDMHNLLQQLLDLGQEIVGRLNREMQTVFDCALEFVKALKEQDEPGRRDSWVLQEDLIEFPDHLEGVVPHSQIYINMGNLVVSRPEEVRQHRDMVVGNARDSILAQLKNPGTDMISLGGNSMISRPVLIIQGGRCRGGTYTLPEAREALARSLDLLSDDLIRSGYFRRMPLTEGTDHERD